MKDSIQLKLLDAISAPENVIVEHGTIFADRRRSLARIETIGLDFPAVVTNSESLAWLAQAGDAADPEILTNTPPFNR